ncbi:hypothetical protein PMAYCL1PPCAC_18123 [Pristionchus mayeri]|uniref:[Histone H3]-trimethyl-L-lysine(4) demethylase n=1 Tax=Pristionchus mayeri TaxID=1317129 RepID=A0AAN5CP01_9BILA|nr:hypothetical protein PMAYCL1PPCAC_18123 [Pristionchus mayeri]
MPFIENVEKQELKGGQSDDEEAEDEKKEDLNRGLGEGRSTMQGGKRHLKSKKEKKKTEMKDEKEKVCGRCFRSDALEKLVACENCCYALHLFCMKPTMKDRPKNGWYCASCIASRVRRMEMNGFCDSDTPYTLTSFTQFANDYKRDIFGKDPSDVTLDDIEKMYWQNMLNGDMNLEVKYGADLMVTEVGSGFCRKNDSNMSAKDRTMAYHPWNLNNMPVVRDSVLSHIDSSISGMMVPWVYVGMVFSTFCWHTEDHWTYSVNYNHWGEPKIWYGIGADQATKFEKVVQSMCPSLFRVHSDLLHHMTVAVNPNLLGSRGVDVYTVHQNPGEFVITFPRAYHAGFNQGLNFAEAVNFAPIDWLSMGRECMLSYGRVGRNCVFAHDELVMKITRSCEKLSTSMALAALDELRIIHHREGEKREEAERKGVKKRERLVFEEIEEDDEKMCRHCNTTLFMSGLRCGHGKSVCLDHMDHLCKKCPLEEAELLFSYEVDELVPMMDQLRERTRKHEEWEGRATTIHQMMENGHKPEMESVERLLDEARGRHYPLTGVYATLHGVMNECKSTLNKAKGVVSEGVRVRSTTRSQRADNRCDVKGGREIMHRLNRLPIEATLLHSQIDMLLTKVEEWEKRVDEVMEGDIDEDEVDKLIEEGDTFNTIRIDRLAPLKEKERRQKWLRGEMKVFLNWRVEECNELSMEWKNKKRWTFNDVHLMIDEGRKVGMGKSSEMKELERRRDEGVMCTMMGRQVMERNSRGGRKEAMAVEETWKRAKEMDWLSAPGLNALRDEMYHIVNIRSYEGAREYSLFDYVQWIDHVECSTTMNTPELVEFPLTQVKIMKEWTDGLRNLFELDHSYHSLYEILISRENMMFITEGQQPELRRTRSIESIELWKPVHVYESSDKMVETLVEAFHRFPTQMEHLRSVHSELPVSRMCPCLSEKEREQYIECIVCRATIHVSCAWWNEYLGRLPPGCYLCVRCLRSRRPLLGEVKTLMLSASKEWMEAQLVQLSIQQFEETAEEVKKQLALWKVNRRDEETEKRLSSLLVTLLSLEMTDSVLLAQLTEPISVVFKSTLEGQRDEWEELRSRDHGRMKTPSSLRGETLFVKSLSFSPLRKRKRKEKEEEKDIPCAHEDCLQPSTHLEWVKCKSCKRWYHAICTGQIIDADTSEYKCC